MTSPLKLALLGLLSTSALAHMMIGEPVPYGKATLDNSPLSATGSDFPCKQRTGVYDITQENNYTVGEENPLTFIGSAVHGGGSCQISLTKDLQPTAKSSFKVITSYIGGCPGTDAGPVNLTFKIPESIPNGQYALAWTWFNKIGNREMYMNCAPVSVSGSTTTSDSAMEALPDMMVANIGNGCTDTETTDPEFPDPGSVVVKGAEATPAPFVGSCAGGTGNSTSGSSGTSAGAAPVPSATGDAGADSGQCTGSCLGGGAAESSAAATTTAAATTAAAASSAAASSAAASVPAGGAASESPAGAASSGGVFAPGASSAAASSAPAASAAPNSTSTFTTMQTVTGSPASSSAAAAAPSAVPSAAPSAAPSASAPAAPAGTGSAGSGGSTTISCTDGDIVCNGTDQFALCNHGQVQWMPVAAGTQCENGQITKRDTGVVVKRSVPRRLRRSS